MPVGIVVPLYLAHIFFPDRIHQLLGSGTNFTQDRNIARASIYRKASPR